MKAFQEVLVVDDDPIIRLSIENTLRQGGHEVAAATKGKDALERLEHRGIQLVVLD